VWVVAEGKKSCAVRDEGMMMTALVLCGVCVSAAPPHLISILQDDLGYHDSGIRNAAAASASANITALARSGIVLNNHYTHWHCSPSRRSFLTGRLPIHHGEQLSADGGDDIDLRMQWISEKLKSVGYKAHMFGKVSPQTLAPRLASLRVSSPSNAPRHRHGRARSTLDASVAHWVPLHAPSTGAARLRDGDR
jgi:arylsulfatase A-like enzyme